MIIFVLVDSDGSEEDNISFKRSKRRRKSTLDEDAHDGPVSHSGLGHTNDGEFNNGRDPRNGVIKIVKSSEFAVIKETKLESNISHESRTSVIVNGRETSSSTKDSAKLTYKATATEIMVRTLLLVVTVTTLISQNCGTAYYRFRYYDDYYCVTIKFLFLGSTETNGI